MPKTVNSKRVMQCMSMCSMQMVRRKGSWSPSKGVFALRPSGRARKRGKGLVLTTNFPPVNPYLIRLYFGCIIRVVISVRTAPHAMPVSHVPQSTRLNPKTPTVGSGSVRTDRCPQYLAPDSRMALGRRGLSGFTYKTAYK